MLSRLAVWVAVLGMMLSTGMVLAGVESGLVAHYRFVDGKVEQQSLGAADGVLRYRSEQGSVLTNSSGRLPGSEAVLLDADSFRGEATDAGSNGFSVAIWLKPFGMGVKRGNGEAANGMIAGCGSGYTDGWRIALYDWGRRLPAFQIGQQGGSFTLTARHTLSADEWNHLVTTWDGSVARIYINGLLSAEQEFDGEYVAAKGGVYLGYAGYGVGSLRFAADELRFYGRELDGGEVAELSLDGAEMGSVGWQALEVLREAYKGDSRERLGHYLKLFEMKSAPAHLQGAGKEYLWQICVQGSGGELPSRVLAKLPEGRELEAQEQQLLGAALGAALAREGEYGAAVAVFEQLLSGEGLSKVEVAGIRMQLGQVLRQGREWERAREQYQLVADEVELPLYVQSLAGLAVAQSWQQQGCYSEAIEAYAAVASRKEQLPHLRVEATEAALECGRLQSGLAVREPERSRKRLAPLPESRVSFVVSPSGRDSNPGTRRRPFRSLERARDAVSELKSVAGEVPEGGVTVWLRGGRYAVTNTFELGEGDSGAFGAPVVYRAWPGERPVLDGGCRVGKFRRVRDEAVLARLVPEARDHVRVADLRQQGVGELKAQVGYGYGVSNKRVREVFHGGKPLQIARWPNEGQLKIEEVSDPTNQVFVAALERAKRWQGAKDIMASGYWKHLWALSTLQVEVDTEGGGSVRMIEKSNYGVREGQPFYLLNMLEEIDQPGEWYIDHREGLLYLWPAESLWFNPVVVSVWDKPFIVAKGVREVVFQGLELEYGQQHGIVLHGCANTAVIGCRIERMGGIALEASSSLNLKIYGNCFNTLGHSGMHVSGGSRKSLSSSQIVIENNEVYNFGRLSKTYSPALLLDGCGTRVAHNWFHHAPSSAMRIEGNDHVIEYNQVDNVVLESDDQGGIDMWGDPSYRGVVIRYNRWQDIGGSDVPCGQAGIRLDDAISGVVIYGNWFERCSTSLFGGVQIHGGHMNIVDNNFFVECRHGVSVSAWGMKRWHEYLKQGHIEKKIFESVNIRVPPYLTRYPEITKLYQQADVNSVWRNVMIGGESFLHRTPKGTDSWANIGSSSMEEFAALKESTIFRPLPLDEIGLYEDEWRVK